MEKKQVASQKHNKLTEQCTEIVLEYSIGKNPKVIHFRIAAATKRFKS